MEQTTSLRTKISESSLRWNLENFLDYSSCCIDKLKSKEVEFADTNASWFLEIWPKDFNESEAHIKIALVVNDKEPSGHRLFKAEITVDSDGQHLMSPANRHLVKARGFYAEPDVIRSPSWKLDYQPNLQTSYENAHFIDYKSISSYLNGGTLTLNARVKNYELFCYDFINIYSSFLRFASKLMKWFMI